MFLKVKSRIAGILLSLFAASPAQAENWLFVQANVFPAGCDSLAECVEASTTEVRNLMAMTATETSAFLTILDDLADVADVPELPTPAATPPVEVSLIDIVPRLQLIEVQGKVDALRGIPGVYFDATRVAGDGTSDIFVTYFTEMLTSAGVPILTQEEASLLPGAARMSVSLSYTRDNAGCIIPFRASLSIKEEVVLVRDPSIKLETTTWSVGVAESFTNTNFKAEDALRSAAQQFIDDYRTANAS